MRAHGANLSKPAHTIHYLYFKSKAAAESAAAELERDGYENIDVHRAPPTTLWQRIFGSPDFSCIAETHAVPEEQAVFLTSDRMNALAKKHNGIYDGWEASVEQ